MSETQNEKTYYGISRESGDLVRVVDVPNGADCNCYCPECRGALIAYANIEGRIYKQAPHFRHESNDGCSGGAETIVHLLAKDILKEDARLTLFIPEKELSKTREFLHDGLLVRTEFHRVVKLSEIQSEVSLDSVRPDVHGLATLSEEVPPLPVNIEIRVTHACDEVKIAKLEALDISTVEIDLRGIGRQIHKPDFKEIIRKALSKKSNQHWLHISDSLSAALPKERRQVGKRIGSLSDRKQSEADTFQIKRRYGASKTEALLSGIQLPLPPLLKLDIAGQYKDYIPEYIEMKALASTYSKPKQVTKSSYKEYILRYEDDPQLISAIRLTAPLANTDAVLSAYKEQIAAGVPFDKENFILFVERNGKITNVYWRNEKIRQLHSQLCKNIDQRLQEAKAQIRIVNSAN